MQNGVPENSQKRVMGLGEREGGVVHGAHGGLARWGAAESALGDSHPAPLQRASSGHTCGTGSE